MAETAQEQRERMRRNSLLDVQRRFQRSGRATKAILRHGLGVQAQDYVVRTGDNPWSIARNLLGPNTSSSQVGALTQSIFAANGGEIRHIRPGETLRIPGVSIPRSARPTVGFMNAVSGASVSPTGPTGPVVPTSPASTLPSSAPPSVRPGGLRPAPADIGPVSQPGLDLYRASEGTPTRTFSPTAPQSGQWGTPAQFISSIASTIWNKAIVEPAAAAGRLETPTQTGTTSLMGINQREAVNIPNYLRNIQADPNRPSGPNVNRNLQQVFSAQEAEAARLTGLAFESAISTQNPTNLPPVISDAVVRSLGLQGEIPYIQQGSNWVLDPTFASAVGPTGVNAPTGITGGFGGFGSPVGNPFGVTFVGRPRRGGVSATGSSAFGGGGSSPTTWSIDF